MVLFLNGKSCVPACWELGGHCTRPKQRSICRENWCLDLWILDATHTFLKERVVLDIHLMNGMGAKWYHLLTLYSRWMNGGIGIGIAGPNEWFC